jgi:hypothetical protein
MPRRRSTTQEIQWADELELALRGFDADANGSSTQHIKLLSWIACCIADGEPLVSTGFLRKKGWRGTGRDFLRAAKWFDKQFAARYDDPLQWRLVRIGTDGGLTNYAFHTLVSRSLRAEPQAWSTSDVMPVDDEAAEIRIDRSPRLTLLTEQGGSTSSTAATSAHARGRSPLLLEYMALPTAVPAESAPVQDLTAILAAQELSAPAAACAVQSVATPDTPIGPFAAVGYRAGRPLSSRRERALSSFVAHALMGVAFFLPAVIYHGLHYVEDQVVAKIGLADWAHGWGGVRCVPTQDCPRPPKS